MIENLQCPECESLNVEVDDPRPKVHTCRDCGAEIDNAATTPWDEVVAADRDDPDYRAAFDRAQGHLEDELKATS